MNPRVGLATLVMALAILLHGATASAVPMYSDFATIRAQVRDVVIGTVHRTPSALTISVDKVVQGSASAPSVMVVKDAPNETVSVDGARVLGLVDKSGQLRWVGQLSSGRTIEDGVLSLHGFFDFNAHLVSPGIATLADVKTLLSTGALTQNYAGTLTFPDGHGALRRSSKHIKLQYDAIARQGTVVGFSAACLVAGGVSGIDWGKPRVSFNDSCATATSTHTRSLTFVGRVTGVDPTTGELQAELTPTAPFVEEADYDTFVADGSFTDVTRVIGLGLPDGTSWSWHVGDGLIDRGGKLHAPNGWTSTLQSSAPGKTVYVETHQFDGASVTLSPAPVGGPLDDDAMLIQAVQSGAITSCTLGRTGLATVPCTLGTSASIWVKR